MKGVILTYLQLIVSLQAFLIYGDFRLIVMVVRHRTYHWIKMLHKCLIIPDVALFAVTGRLNLLRCILQYVIDFAFCCCII